jgi:Xaa-Pro aminopeptidase
MPIKELFDKNTVQDRRKELVSRVEKTYTKEGVILLLASFEKECHVFKQDPSFWYFTGIEEPAAALMIDVATKKTTLFVPNFGTERVKWVSGAISSADASRYGIDEIRYLGKPCVGYQCHPFFTDEEYADLLTILNEKVAQKQTIYTLYPDTTHSYIEQRFVIQRMNERISSLKSHIEDISEIVAELRRKKSKKEIEYLFKAVAITGDAQYAAAQSLSPEKKEYDVQAVIEYVFTSSGSSLAFPSIVASGKNATILHYGDNNTQLKNGDLVVIDIGAEYNNYCADITRTYPVSGVFTQRQRELYNLVLEVQEHVAQHARPGYWLSNKDNPEKSLNHIARKYLEDKGYAQYFYHGIGHFLGLDVHDVGNYSKPLESGDVITIEPGLYIKEEGIGIRIEDDYWIIEDGSICLSEDIAKHPDDIEMLVQQKHEEQREHLQEEDN